MLLACEKPTPVRGIIMKRKPDHISKKDWDSVNSPPLSDGILSRMKPIQETKPDIPPRVRGSQKHPTKIPVSIRLDQDVVEYFKSQGKGWQTKVNNILRKYAKSHPAS